MLKSPTSDDMILERARQLALDSFLFRTTVVASIHQEVYEACWDGWDSYITQKGLLKFRDSPRSTLHVRTGDNRITLKGGASIAIKYIKDNS